MGRAFPIILGVKLLLLCCGEVAGFLGRGSVLEGYGDVLGVFCPDFILRTPVWHHREITREGIRRSVVKYFQEAPAEGVPFSYRYGMTLEEVYQERYGPHASPSRFVLALEDIADAAAETDAGQSAMQPAFHFNNDQFEESQEVLELRWQQLTAATRAREVAGARHLLGLALAAVQDFYAHSNWIELGNDQILECLGLPGNCTFSVAGTNQSRCDQCPSEAQDCRRLLSSSLLRQDLLTSEYLPHAPGSASVRGKCEHPLASGGSRSAPARAGIGKDLPSVCFSNRADLHDRAARLAARATSHYLTALRREVGEDLFRLLLALDTRPPVVLVYGGAGDLISRARHTSDCLMQVLDDLQAKHKAAANPPIEYVLVLYSNSLTGGGVFRSNEPKGLLDHMKTLADSVPSYIMLNPIKALLVAAHIAVPDSEVFIVTDAQQEPPGKTSVLHIRELITQKRIKVTPIIVSTFPMSRTSRYTNEKLADDPHTVPFTLPLPKDENHHESLDSSLDESLDNTEQNSTLPPSNIVSIYDTDDDEESPFSIPDQYPGAFYDEEIAEEETDEVRRRRKRSLSPEILARLERLGFSVVPRIDDDLAEASGDTPAVNVIVYPRYPLLETLTLRSANSSEKGWMMGESSLGGPGASEVSASVTYQALEHLALISGSHIIDATYQSLQTTLEYITLENRPQVLLYRDLRATNSKIGTFPIDTRIQKIWIALYGNFSEAIFVGPDGVEQDLLPMSDPEIPPLFKLKTSTILTVGEYTLRYSPAPHYSVSVMVWGASVTDITATFYRADSSLSPSLQRMNEAPTAGKPYFLNLLATGVDTSDLWRVKSVEFEALADADCAQKLPLPTTSPRRSSYVRLADGCSVPDQPFSVVYEAQDFEGHSMVRRSPRIFQSVTSLVTFDDPRDIPWLSGQTVAVSFTVANIAGKPDTFRLTTSDVMGVVEVVAPKSVTIENGQSKSLTLELTFMPRFYAKTNFINITQYLHYPPPPSHNSHGYYRHQTTTPPPVLMEKSVTTDLNGVTNVVFVTATSSSGVASTAFAYVYVVDFSKHVQTSQGGNNYEYDYN